MRTSPRRPVVLLTQALVLTAVSAAAVSAQQPRLWGEMSLSVAPSGGSAQYRDIPAAVLSPMIALRLAGRHSMIFEGRMQNDAPRANCAAIGNLVCRPYVSIEGASVGYALLRGPESRPFASLATIEVGNYLIPASGNMNATNVRRGGRTFGLQLGLEQATVLPDAAITWSARLLVLPNAGGWVWSLPLGVGLRAW